MISVLDTTRLILQSDEIALEAMQQGILNFSAYAQRIHLEVEKKSLKPVKIGTIVVALTRLAKKIEELPILRPRIKVENLIIKSPLYEATFDKTSEILNKSAELAKLAATEDGFFAITQGLSEVTIIASEKFKHQIQRNFGSMPKSEYQNLIAVTVRFGDEYLSVPNVIYSLVSVLAGQRINIIEIVSTYTELSFILEKEDMQAAIKALNEQFT